MRSIQASRDGLDRITEKFKRTGWTQDNLAGRAECSRPTVIKFLAGQLVDKETFKKICLALDLDWGNIADLDREQTDSIKAADIDKLVVSVKQQIRQYIEDRCGKMRVLDMTYPIGVSQIYTDVNILEKITATKWIKISELQKRVYADTHNFDRLSGGTIEKRVLGEDAVNIQHKLVVLGKPGSGKTTFLKHLAMQCLNSKFQSLRIPIFITLKEYSENKNNLSILDFIKNEFRKLVNEENIDFLLAQGRVLILLDGLDEVKEEEQERVCEQIEIFTRDASKLTQDFAIDREKNYQERGKLQNAIKQIEIELNPKQELGENIQKLRQKEFSVYTRNIKKISDREKKGLHDLVCSIDSN
jgi:predicted NACHT family NTPase